MLTTKTQRTKGQAKENTKKKTEIQEEQIRNAEGPGMSIDTYIETLMVVAAMQGAADQHIRSSFGVQTRGIEPATFR